MLSVLSLPAFSFSAGAEEAPAAAEASTGEPDAGPEKENDGAEPEAAEEKPAAGEVSVNPVEAGPAVAPRDENGKIDATKIADANDFGDWEEQGCKG